jgi:CRISPR-associated protein Csb1
MPVSWEALQSAPRLLAEARLRPGQGERFQPTGFPDLGAAIYEVPSNGSTKRMLLVESAQSMANRLEDVCWDHAANDLVGCLQGMPYVRVNLWNSGDTTNSILEAHRLNSPYVMSDDKFKETLREKAGVPRRGRSQPTGEDDEGQDLGGVGLLNRRELAKAAFYYDPGSVLHGVFLEKLDGRTRLQRVLSAFIEAENVADAHSGGVKNDRVAPRPSALQEVGISVTDPSGRTRAVRAAEGYGNVPYHRTEYVAESITAYFSLDLAQLRAYGLGGPAEKFLTTLALWKIRSFLETGLRLRTACDLVLKEEVSAEKPHNFSIPSLGDLEADLPGLIQQCAAAGLFANPPITELTFGQGRR